MTWVIAILKPLQLYLQILVFSFYRKETKPNLCSGLVYKKYGLRPYHSQETCPFNEGMFRV